MHIKIMEVGMLGTNCYLAYCDETKEGVIIDPGGDGERINKVIEESGIEIKYIINTHGHHDHIGANEEVKEFTGKDLLIHENDADMLVTPRHNSYLFGNQTKLSPPADGFLKEGDVVEFGNSSLEVIHLPGHTEGGIGLYSEKDRVIFVGDTLFYGSIGRTDLPHSDFQKMTKSLARLMELPDDTIVLPGHGPKTTIATEKQINPFI